VALKVSEGYIEITRSGSLPVDFSRGPGYFKLTFFMISIIDQAGLAFLKRLESRLGRVLRKKQPAESQKPRRNRYGVPRLPRPLLL